MGRKGCCRCGSSQKQVLGKGFLSNCHLHGAWKDSTFSPVGGKAQSAQAAKEYEWEVLGSEIVIDLLDYVHMEAWAQPRDGTKLGRVMR